MGESAYKSKEERLLVELEESMMIICLGFVT